MEGSASPAIPDLQLISQSALEPAGRDAERIATMFWWMVGGGALVWLAVMGITFYAVRARGERHNPRRARAFIIGGGALVPTLVLAVLLTWGLGQMPALLDKGPDDGLRIHVSAEQWWWRVRYELADGTEFELANEIRLPIERRTPVWLHSADVIHSFWVPSLAGKLDMIPGRVNRMALEPTREGVFRGVCAEYCGSSHANMMFDAVVQTPNDFEAWARAQALPASPPQSDAARRGERLFELHGCGACHTVRGTPAGGAVGPDLTHVGSRLRLGAGVLPNDMEGFQTWLARTQEQKPDVHMPSFHMLSSTDLRALASYLEGLQ